MLARAKAGFTVLEYIDDQRREFDWDMMLPRDGIEQANILADQIHGEVDVAAAVEDHLAFGFVHEAVARGDADRLIRGVHVEPGGLAHGQRLGQRDQMDGAQVVGHDLELRGGPQFARVEDPAAHGGQDRQDKFERRPFAPGEYGDVARIGAVAAARYRALHHHRASGFNQCAQPDNLAIVGRAHFEP